MNTWTHFLVNAVLDRPIKRHQQNKEKSERKLPPMRTGAFLIGSIMPDVPLILMGIGAVIYDLAIGRFKLRDIFSGPPDPEQGMPEEMMNSTIGKLFDDWFFNDPWVITGHHLFGSPLLVCIYIALGYWLWRNRNKFGGWLFWFAVGCMIHTTADIFLHVDDGPLLLFPLDWEWRFHSPVSYWDRKHYGAEVAWIENRLDVVLILWLVGSWIWRKVRGSSDSKKID